MIAPLLALTLAAPAPQDAAAEDGGFPGLPVGFTPKVEIAWNRLYDYDEIHAHFDRLIEAYPTFLSMQVLTHSVENRELRLYTLHNPEIAPDIEKPAMWIDGNVHGNEVQGAEVTLYTAWYLLENYASNPRVKELVDHSTFYIAPMINPDGRANWFKDAHTASSSRSGYQPTDNDGDGLFDEDGPDDLDGDGHITQMRRWTPGEGTHRADPDDPRVMVRVPTNDKGIRGDWILLGREGVDNDGDGRVNEDGPGGYDMNRAWPSYWQPGHVQYGAGPYPLYWPETRAVATFVIGHPNIAAVQSFHNAGGMILRGPGIEAFGNYPAADVRVYDQLGREGEQMLPFYRYMILWKDLYSVFGGFVTWTYEGLGIISFTNELWSRRQLYPDSSRDSGGDQHFFDDKLLMGAGFVDWHPVDHPLYGKIEIGGFRKDVGRVPPTFLIEEMLHRNALFCLRHAEAMPRIEIDEPVVTDLGKGLKVIDVVFRNVSRIPTRTARAVEMKIGRPDVFVINGRRIEVISGGFRTDRFRPEAIELAESAPRRLVREEGIPGGGEVRVRWFVRGNGSIQVGWRGQKAQKAKVDLEID